MFGKINLLKGKLNNSSEGEGKLQSQFAPIPKNKKIKKDSHLKLQEKYSDLQGAKFRLLNEMLYTNDSVSSVGYFRDNKEDFQLYHEGYRHQASKWEYRPVDQIIQYLLQNKQAYLKRNIADLGCGEGFIYESLVAKGFSPQRIKSYDLVSVKPFITVADSSKLPLRDQTISLCIFCLSLMGTNYLQFIKEARRVLKAEGELIISEVESRSKDWKRFVDMVCAVGFKLVNNALDLPVRMPKRKEEARFFRTMLFRKQEETGANSLSYKGKKCSLQQLSTAVLQSCTYKRR